LSNTNEEKDKTNKQINFEVKNLKDCLRDAEEFNKNLTEVLR